MAKVQITFSDDEKLQATRIELTFDPEINESTNLTPAQVLGVELLNHLKNTTDGTIEEVTDGDIPE